MVRILLLFLAFLFSGCLYEGPNFQELDYLPLNDSEYPYANIPRIVIETEQLKEIRDKDSYQMSYLQIYGEKNPLSEIYELKIRGRGHSSFKFPKFSYRLKFAEKVSLFGMPANKDWILLSNFADKTMLKNKLAFSLDKALGSPYTPRSEFVELYINREYLGVYQLTEKIEVAKKRVNIPETEESFLVEVDHKFSETDPVVFSKFYNLPLNIHSPKNVSEKSKIILDSVITDFEKFLLKHEKDSLDLSADFFDKNSYFRYYWVQEFARNVDGAFSNSVYFTWFKGSKIKLGPLWDMDIAFGGAHEVYPEGYYIRNHSWNAALFSNAEFKKQVVEYWKAHKEKFENHLDSLEIWKGILRPAAKNNFKRWPVLESTESWAHRESVDSYDEAVDVLKEWIKTRYGWIETNLEE